MLYNRPDDHQTASVYKRLQSTLPWGIIFVCSFPALWCRMYILATRWYGKNTWAQENKAQEHASIQHLHMYTSQRFSILLFQRCCLDRFVGQGSKAETQVHCNGAGMLSSGPPFARRKLRRQRLLHHDVVRITAYDNSVLQGLGTVLQELGAVRQRHNAPAGSPEYQCSTEPSISRDS